MFRLDQTNEQHDADKAIRNEGDPFVGARGLFDDMLYACDPVKEDTHTGGGQQPVGKEKGGSRHEPHGEIGEAQFPDHYMTFGGGEMKDLPGRKSRFKDLPKSRDHQPDADTPKDQPRKRQKTAGGPE